MNKEKTTMGKATVIAEPGKQDITMIRVFDAPRDLVYKVYMDPQLVSKWWGLRNSTTIVDKMEPRVGGQWRFVQSELEGGEFAFRGVYHEIQAPERTVSTYEFEGMPGHVGLVTTYFEEENGKTTLREVSLFPSVEDRDGIVASGMEFGANETYDRLEELLATMK
jgi:uncharacterized protein YndB with AHSA1/START domain